MSVSPTFSEDELVEYPLSPLGSAFSFNSLSPAAGDEPPLAPHADLSSPEPTSRDSHQADPNSGLIPGLPKAAAVSLHSLFLSLKSSTFFDPDEKEWHVGPIVDPSEWEAFRAAAAFVEDLLIDNRGDEEEAGPTIAQASYFRLSQLQQPDICLFPRLTRLNILTSTKSSSLSHIFLFVSPVLRSLKISNILNGDRAVIASFLNHPEVQLSLTELSLGPLQYSFPLVQAIATCHHLQALEMRFLTRPLNQRFIQLLGALTQLNTLTIHADSVPYQRVGVNVCNSMSHGFVQLEHLHFMGNFSLFEAILQRVSPNAKIQSLHIQLSRHWDHINSPLQPRRSFDGVVQSSKFFELLNREIRQWKASLRSFTIALDNKGYAMAKSATSLLEPLIALSQLEHLHIAGLGMADADQALRCLEHLWRNMKELHFAILEEGRSESISLSTFSYILERSPSLVSFRGLVTLPTDIDQLAIHETAANSSSHCLRTLSVGSITQLHPPFPVLHGIALLLDRLCPELEVIHSHPGFSPNLWDELSGLLKSFQAVRREERKRLKSNLSLLC